MPNEKILEPALVDDESSDYFDDYYSSDVDSNCLDLINSFKPILGHLPFELLFRVLGYLEVEDIARLAAVNMDLMNFVDAFKLYPGKLKRNEYLETVFVSYFSDESLDMFDKLRRFAALNENPDYASLLKSTEEGAIFNSNLPSFSIYKNYLLKRGGLRAGELELFASRESFFWNKIVEKAGIEVEEENQNYQNNLSILNNNLRTSLVVGGCAAGSLLLSITLIVSYSFLLGHLIESGVLDEFDLAMSINDILYACPLLFLVFCAIVSFFYTLASYFELKDWPDLIEHANNREEAIFKINDVIGYKRIPDEEDSDDIILEINSDSDSVYNLV